MKASFKTSTKPIVTAMLMALQAPAFATDSDNEIYERYPQQDAGLGYGLLVGAVLGGPAGAVVGSAVGALIGHGVGSEKALQDTRIQLSQAEANLTQLSQNQTPVQVASDCGGMQTVAYQKPVQADPLHDILAQGFAVNILFRTGSDQLEPQQQRQLDELARVLVQVPGLAVELSGHADLRGAEKENLNLSARRLEQVEAVLIGAGIAPTRIASRAQGEKQAQAGIADRDGQAFDRQVAVRFVRHAPLLEAAK